MIPTCMNFAATEVYELRDKVNCGDIERAVVIQERLWDLANFVNDESKSKRKNFQPGVVFS